MTRVLLLLVNAQSKHHVILVLSTGQTYIMLYITAYPDSVLRALPVVKEEEGGGVGGGGGAKWRLR